jgi:hypothetical protein
MPGVLNASARIRPCRSLTLEMPSRVARAIAKPLSTPRNAVSLSLSQASRPKFKSR